VRSTVSDLAEARAQRIGGADAAGAAARAEAARAVRAVRNLGRSLSDLPPAAAALPDERDRALVQELSYGTLRVLPRLEAIAKPLFRKALKAEDQDIAALVEVGLYQLTATRIPSHAAVAATVAATRCLRKPWAASLVNALLRRFLRERDALLAHAEQSLEGRWLFPRWLLEELQWAWPESWQAIVAASNRKPPMTLRVNLMRTTASAYAARLAAAGLAGRPLRLAPAAILLDRAVPAAILPGFSEGLVSVQDAGAQLAAELLDARPGEAVLDACAAPGGKSAHLLERAANRLALTAVDVDTERLERVRDSLGRLGLDARVLQGDAAAPSGIWAQRQYRRILLDVPCSATGVIRRHPDIKWLRRPEDLGGLIALQAHMLDSIWPLLEPGGSLLYVTCSLLPQENEQQIEAFLARQRDARVLQHELPWGVARGPGRQTLPEDQGTDGFFYASLEKAT
jgi:16S rRNA (cytosine967-C5)-methyltransferase